eukprot:TRINITY_DN11780_c0_g2_i1.p1 TRINITY_DN11780_c0_g2~~TRINITY_DN11780_c0_g2_i1.p1  ORF type:complete len:607 (+),score=66.03 TRINITY_DN11780_c0_g2_i1:169-1989(+)
MTRWQTLIISLAIAIACPPHSTESDGDHCLCEEGFVCRSSGYPPHKSGKPYECSRAFDYHHLRQKTGFSEYCKYCSCVPREGPKTTTISNNQLSLPQIAALRNQGWHIGVEGMTPNSTQDEGELVAIDHSTEYMRWIQRAKGYLDEKGLKESQQRLALDSPWSVLCHRRYADDKPTGLHQSRPHQYTRDGRLSLWVHADLMLHPEAGPYLAKELDYDARHFMSSHGRYIMAIYIYDLREDGPVLVIHPTQYLHPICASFNPTIKGHTSGVHIAMEHVMHLLPSRLAHAHYKNLSSFMDIMQGKPAKQVVLPPSDSALKHCRQTWPHEHSKVINTDYAGHESEHATLAMLIPSYSGHWPYFRALVDHVYRQTEQPDQLVISSSETNIGQARAVLYSLPDVHGFNRMVVVAKLAPDKAAGNRNTGMALVRMRVTELMDGDDLPHPQRTELIRWLYRHRPFSLFAHSGMRSHMPIRPIPCLPNVEMIQAELWDALNLTTRGGTRPVTMPIQIQGKSRAAYAMHGHTAFETRFFRVAYWEGGTGQDQRFDQMVLVAGQAGNYSESIYMSWPLVFYFQVSRTTQVCMFMCVCVCVDVPPYPYERVHVCMCK